MEAVDYKPLFPWFGGKSRAADLIWSRLGDVQNYVEPFFGSGAVMFLRPHEAHIETVNDADGYIANFWRAVQADPEQVAHWSDNPVNENDLHARHVWLVERKAEFTQRVEGDPEYFDAKVAGWWVWGICCWIGSGWCSGKGPWGTIEDEEGYRKLVHLGDAGRGVNRQRESLLESFQWFTDRLRGVRVCCGDWKRVCGPTPTIHHGLTGVVLDPPYADTAKRSKELYRMDCLSVAHDVRKWAIEQGQNRLMRIALCGYDGEHEMPEDWTCEIGLATSGGYGNQSKEGNDNAKKERIWFSPHCLKDESLPLFNE